MDGMTAQSVRPAIADVLRTSLTPEQYEAATVDGPVLVLAGAGTGKTKTLTAAAACRIIDKGILPSRLLAVTFTNKAAAEMTGRIRSYLGSGPIPSWLGTFHGLAARQLRLEPEIAGLRHGFDILDADDSKRLLKRVMKHTGMLECGRDGDALQSIKTMWKQIGAYKDTLVTPDAVGAYVDEQIASFAAAGDPLDPLFMRQSVRIYREYQRRLRECNGADFGDLLLWPTTTMQADEAYRQRWAGRFDAVLADEYQDVNHAQFQWLTLLARDHRRLFVVGDDSQAIYSWRGSDVRFIRRFTEDFPEAKVVRLEENFRSTGHIIAAANAVISVDTSRLGQALFTRKPAGSRVEIVGFRNGEAEAHGVVNEIRRHNALGVAWEEMAILYRGNVLSRPFEEALMRARVPYVIIGDVGFYQRAEIKGALALLRLATMPDDRQSDEAFRRMINTPARRIGVQAMNLIEDEARRRQVSLFAAVPTTALGPVVKQAAVAFVDAVLSVREDLSASLADQISLLVDVTGYRKMLRESRAETTEGRLENLQELIVLAGGFHSTHELLDHATLSGQGLKESEGGRVQLMTLHKGKGLEFGHVFLPAWEQGMFPSPWADFAEERRLAYVAITRGMKRVTISHCEFRRGHTQPSCFLADIPLAHSMIGKAPR
ncbi:MAG: ATP-dependent helicase [Janthinobacterium lividum]